MQKARVGKDGIGTAVRIAGSTGRVAAAWMNSGVPGVNDISINTKFGGDHIIMGFNTGNLINFPAKTCNSTVIHINKSRAIQTNTGGMIGF